MFPVALMEEGAPLPWEGSAHVSGRKSAHGDPFPFLWPGGMSEGTLLKKGDSDGEDVETAVFVILVHPRDELGRCGAQLHK